MAKPKSRSAPTTDVVATDLASTHSDVPSFIGSCLNGPGEAVIVLRGHIDAAAVERVGHHVDDLLAVDVRFLRINASAMTGYDPTLNVLLGYTQRRLSRRRGMLQMRIGRTLPRDAAPAIDGPT